MTRNASFTVPAGTYYLGDPCYAVPEEMWDEYCEKSYPDNINHVPVVTFDTGETVYVFSTCYGDGCYRGSDGYEYGVDAGIIGLVPEALARREGCWDLGTKIVLDRPTDCVSINGDMDFGVVTINTSGSDEDEEDDSYDEDPYGENDE